jgi:N-glycosylase/DNA lyase
MDKRMASASDACASTLAREIRSDYAKIKPRIEKRLREFKEVWRDSSDEELFAELVFCLFTPQSKAKSCWASVCELVDAGVLTCGEPAKISARMHGVRFHNNKGRYVAEAQRLFTSGRRLRIRETLDGLGRPREIREWLVANVVGMGHKEASHFLRNVGKGAELAILDRHILRNMRALGYIAELPRSISPRRYLELERTFLGMAKDLGIAPASLDMLLWYRAAGDVFK